MEALRALARNDGVECLHVAAYELREFMNALPYALDVPVLRYEELIAKARSFVADWKKRSSQTSCLNKGKWGGSIDGDLAKLLDSGTVFVGWFEEQVPSRRAEAAVVLQKLSPTEFPVPPAMMDLRTAEWSALLRYFNGYTHHDSDPDPLEFRAKIERLEGFLLEHLEPRTFEDQGEIDQLIREVEGQ